MAASVISGVYSATASLAGRARTAGVPGWFLGTPEVYFVKAIDNSRLVKVADPQRKREMKMFAAALVVLFAVVMVYAWQHFSAIQYGYDIEAQKVQRDTLMEENRALRLEEASLRDPERIDTLARQMGLGTPETGQVVRLETASEPGVPVMAQAQIAVVTAAQ